MGETKHLPGVRLLDSADKTIPEIPPASCDLLFNDDCTPQPTCMKTQAPP